MGACVSTAGGTIVCSARNRVNDGAGPPGEIFGSALAHAEINALARLPFGSHRDLILTTTLQPCLQCRRHPVRPDRHHAVRGTRSPLGRVPRLRQAVRPRGTQDPAGQDRPRRDDLAIFATVISRFAHLPPGYEEALRALGEGPMVALVHELNGTGEVERLAAMDVAEGLRYPWPRLQQLTAVLPS